MPCDRKLRRNQTIKQRATELKEAASKVATGLTAGKYKIKISPTGAVAFSGIPEEVRDGATDACIYRRILASGNATALAAIAKAEALAGRSVSKQTLASGTHSHDGGITFHDHKG